MVIHLLVLFSRAGGGAGPGQTQLSPPLSNWQQVTAGAKMSIRWHAGTYRQPWGCLGSILRNLCRRTRTVVRTRHGQSEI